MPKKKEPILHGKFPPINKLRASILDRKLTTGMTWSDIGEGAGGYTGDYMRKLISTRDPWEWPTQIREGVCKTLQISIRRVINDGWDDET